MTRTTINNHFKINRNHVEKSSDIDRKGHKNKTIDLVELFITDSKGHYFQRSEENNSKKIQKLLLCFFEETHWLPLGTLQDSLYGRFESYGFDNVLLVLKF